MVADVCDINHRPEKPEENPGPEEIKELLSSSRKIAVVGLSNKPHRDSYLVGSYLVDHGYLVYPVHPNLADWKGLKVAKSLHELAEPVDIVDLFRNAEGVGEMVDEIIACKPKAAWMQLGVVNNEAAAKLREAGIMVIQDKCIKIEHHNLTGS